ncbi:hypothetical protein [Actinocorallia populi]|uniref:hypothetical protein n=1 Tax=Actinocorallia populi TaxID=2079200 RepID=UPI0018E50EF7|nr:hypothetical protein [Actinocorallia populi]
MPDGDGMTAGPTFDYVFVHGACAESASWNGVIRCLHECGHRSVAVADPLRGLEGTPPTSAT